MYKDQTFPPISRHLVTVASKEKPLAEPDSRWVAICLDRYCVINFFPVDRFLSPELGYKPPKFIVIQEKTTFLPHFNFSSQYV